LGPDRRDYAYYLDERQKELSASCGQPAKTVNTAKAADHKGTRAGAAGPRDRGSSGRSAGKARALKELEGKIEQMEEQIRLIEGQMDLYCSDAVKLKELFDEKAVLDAELELCYREWEAAVSGRDKG